ncbi:hypothetical protein UY3_08930 [Chelonia mydas]|uniref:Uncharacterized protein n=1 Tax=Chelonia mydas TaxID=8469 RepID=M7B9T7_CHEMY|nr:hypothetical protein UY3_08930 [Chelonia mydas]
MSTTNVDDAKPEDVKQESEKKIFYCEQRAGPFRERHGTRVGREPACCAANWELPKNTDTKHTVLSTPNKGDKLFLVASQDRVFRGSSFCMSKEFPDKMKKNTPGVKEDKVSFLRRIAREIEKTEGLKIYKTGGFATGINEWLKQFNQSASVSSQSTSVGGTSPYFTYSGSGYSTEYKSNSAQGNKTTEPDNRSAYGVGSTNWKSERAFTNTRNLPDQRSTYSASSATYPSSGGYSTNYPLQGCSSYYRSGSANSTSSSRGGSSWSEELRYQKSNFKTDSASFRSSSSVHNSYRDCQQQNRESDKMFDENASGLTPNILHRLRGKDVPTMTRMLKQLTPYYPALQSKIVKILSLVKPC